jgi:hypothetical protein
MKRKRAGYKINLSFMTLKNIETHLLWGTLYVQVQQKHYMNKQLVSTLLSTVEVL